jgi:hypothetical protein
MNTLSNFENLFITELSSDEQIDTYGGVVPAGAAAAAVAGPIIAAAGAVLLVLELYSWGYEYAKSRLN